VEHQPPDQAGRRCPEWTGWGQALRLFARGVTVRTALPVALLVGLVLSAVNQTAVIATGRATVVTWIRVGFNFVVPFVVSSVGYLSGGRDSR
jgi:hypothetical protein